MLVLDIFDNWIPASVVVDLIAISRGINNVQAQTDSVLLDNVRDGLDFSCRTHWLIGSKPSFRVDQVRRKDSVNEGRLS